MKFKLNSGKTYLLFAYAALALLVRFIFSDYVGISTLWQPIIYGSLLVFIILSHETLLKAIQQLTGSPSNIEMDVFSKVLELNKKIQSSIDADKVLKLVEVTLKDQFNADQVLIYLNEAIESDSFAFINTAGKSAPDAVKIWPRKEGTAELGKELVNELVRHEHIFTQNDNYHFAEELFNKTQTDLAIPVVHNRQLLCLILLSHYKNDSFYLYQGEQTRVLDYLSSQLALILDRIRVYQQVMLQTAMDHAEKMQVMQSISSNIAHEMRTPLSGIRASISGVEEYLPELTRAYHFAQKQVPDDFHPIREDHLKSLNSTLNRITLMIDQANTVIDMLLMNLRETSLDENQMNVCSAAECIEQAIERYPFKSGELELVDMDLDEDFKFLGIESMFIYVIFNLVKNSLHSLRSAQKGLIYISLETGKQMDPLRPTERFNVIYFRDTGMGISEDVKDRVFDSFFTTKEGGTGAGLAYCKRTIESFMGKVECQAVKDEYCEFIISVPELKQYS